MGFASLNPSYESPKLSFPLTPRKPPWATNGKGRFGRPRTAHALPRRTQSVVRLVVDGGPPPARRHHRADVERGRAVAGGESGGRDPDRARSLPLLQSPGDVPAAVADRDDRRILHVAETDPAHGADRV